MRAWRYEAFGPVERVLRLVQMDDPVPAAGQVLVRVQWAAANPLDFKLVEGQFRRFAKSKPPAGVGVEFAGDVVALGAGVDASALGTRVVGSIDAFARPPGAMQTRVVMAAADLCLVPEGVGLDAAVTLPVAGRSALQMCRMARVGTAKRVLVHGAAGGVGGFAVQIARLLGAEVTGTGSGASADAIGDLGAQAIDYARPVETWGGPFDAVLDCTGRLTANDLARLMPGGGHYVTSLPAFPSMLIDPLRNLFVRTKRHTLRLHAAVGDLRLLLHWVADGLLVPRIAERFGFDDLVGALLRLRDGHARGKLLIGVS